MKKLQEGNISYELFTHKPVYTCDVMAEYLDAKEKQILKCLVLRTQGGEFVLLMLPGDERFDSQRIAKLLNTKRVSFAHPEEVKQAVGCEIGCVPPFGHITSLKTYLVKEILRQHYVFFNPGVHTKSIRINPQDLLKLCSQLKIF